MSAFDTICSMTGIFAFVSMLSTGFIFVADYEIFIDSKITGFDKIKKIATAISAFFFLALIAELLFGIYHKPYPLF